MSFYVLSQIEFRYESFRAAVAELCATMGLMGRSFLVGFQVLVQCDLEGEGFWAKFTLERFNRCKDYLLLDIIC